jgi:hypothetical protein
MASLVAPAPLRRALALALETGQASGRPADFALERVRGGLDTAPAVEGWSQGGSPCYPTPPRGARLYTSDIPPNPHEQHWTTLEAECLSQRLGIVSAALGRGAAPRKGTHDEVLDARYDEAALSLVDARLDRLIENPTACGRQKV